MKLQLSVIFNVVRVAVGVVSDVTGVAVDALVVFYVTVIGVL